MFSRKVLKIDRKVALNIASIIVSLPSVLVALKTTTLCEQLLSTITNNNFDRAVVVAQVAAHLTTDREVPGFDSLWELGFFLFSILSEVCP